MEWLALLQDSIVYCDTAPLIYYLEINPKYTSVVDPFFEALDSKQFQIVTSTLTLLEVLVLPLRTKNHQLANAYKQLLTTTEGVQVTAVTDLIAQEAAMLRGMYNLRTPDAIHMATALVTGSTYFITNDRIFQRIPNIHVLVLDDLIDNPAD